MNGTKRCRFLIMSAQFFIVHGKDTDFYLNATAFCEFFLSYFQEVVSIYALCMLRAVQELIRKNISRGKHKKAADSSASFFLFVPKSQTLLRKVFRGTLAIFASFLAFSPPWDGYEKLVFMAEEMLEKYVFFV